MREIPFGKPIIGDEEKKAVLDVLNGPILVHGPKSKEFEERFAAYTGAPHAVSVSSCTAAMHLAYFDLGLKSGDEVIVPAQTHTATAHAVELCGAKPVFVDAEIKTGNIDIDRIEEALTSRTKAISIVHFLGMPVDMDRIMSIAKENGLFVLEDCALAIRTYYRGIHAGLHGDVACFSFYPIKHITTAEGGILLTKNADLAARIELKRAFGVDRNVGDRKIPGAYDVAVLGFNYRMNEVQAAIGVKQIERMDCILKKREENYRALAVGLGEIDEVELFESSHGEFTSSYYCMSLILKASIASKRFEFVESLKRKRIGTSVYYPKPVPHLSYYKKKYGFGEDSFPIASLISYHSVALPVGPHLGVEDMEYIVKSVKEAIVEVK